MRVSRYGKGTNPLPEGLRGWHTRLPRAALRAVADGIGSTVELLEARRDTDMDGLRRSLRMSASRGKDSTSPLIIVRPLIAPVSEPIEATSDDAALFELLASVGGKMPTVEV